MSSYSVTLPSPSPPRRMPLRAFVHEVLRRSKTMWPALQIALCYLDAAKCKVPGAIAEAKQGEGLQAAEAALDELFGTASADDLNGERPSVPRSSSTPQTLINSPSSAEENNNTVPSDQSRDQCDILSNSSSPVPPAPAVAPVDTNSSGSSRRNKRRRTPPVPVSPLPPRPSPLLCPRRMFVAALILAAKFTQDRVYSNRAWAKISGLDAREVGRCERALGEALDWRLWVGKGVADEPTAFLRNFLLAEEALAKSKTNGLARSKSDGALLSGSNKEVTTPSWSHGDARCGDLSSALKRSTSLNSGDLSCSPRTSTPMLSDPATLVLTPANADLDAMDLQPTPLLQHSTCSSTSSSFSIDTTPTTSFFSNEFSFTPAVVNILPTPQVSSQYTPDLHFSDADTVSYVVPHSKLASGLKTEFGLDPLMGISHGVEGTFDMGIDDIVGDR
jgi:PHO85 cyclin-5